jgi:hypothetical protein
MPFQQLPEQLAVAPADRTLSQIPNRASKLFGFFSVSGAFDPVARRAPRRV